MPIHFDEDKQKLKLDELRRKEEEDFYDEEFVEDLLEDDEISAFEAAFMHGYIES